MLLEKCITINISPTPAATFRRTFLLRAYSLLLTGIGRDSGTATINVRFFEKIRLHWPECALFKHQNRQHAGRKINKTFGFHALFVAFSVYRPVGEELLRPMSHVYKNLSELRPMLIRERMQHEPSLQSSSIIQPVIYNNKALLKNALNAYCETRLYTLKCNQHDSIIENFDSLRFLEPLSESAL